MRTLATLALIAAVATAAAAQPPAAPPPASPWPASLIREGVTEKLTPHVWAIPDGSASLVPNVGIIVGTKAVLVVDTGMGARNAATILKEVAKVGVGLPIYIVTTHVHPEHDLAAHAFPADSKLIRSNAQVQEIGIVGLTLANTFAARSPLNAELLKDVQHRKADITFDTEYVLDLGGVTARIMAMGTNHTRGDTAVWIESEKVLFSGDVAMRGQPSFATQGDAVVSHWLFSLKRFEALKPVHVVPAHGLRGDAAIITGYQTYLGQILTRAAILKSQGKTQAEVLATVTEEMAGKYPDRGRLGGAIRAAYAEAR